MPSAVTLKLMKMFYNHFVQMITIIIQYVDYNKQVATPKVKVTLKLK